ncbi:hypothetical protein QYE76_060344 [Lolium multiflorum]|uniref:Reverse transcriptase domain-containing protein n=1 Tax=Lolium multiflorum TaxID=4521 RepID=A0AAD8RYV9_LOLMU|nr:hypothetical protein QYE76_060344 [Lolium multiflorum]
MHAFIGGLRRGGLLRHKLTCTVNANKLTLDEMINIASDHTAADDGRRSRSYSHTPAPTEEVIMASQQQQAEEPSEDQKGGGSNMVAMTFQRGGSGGGRGRGRGGGAGRGKRARVTAGSRAPKRTKNTGICRPSGSGFGQIHPHQSQCKWVNDLKNDPEAGYKRARKHRPRGKGGKGKNKDKEEEGTAANKSNPFGKKSVGTYHTFLGTQLSARKIGARILNATVPAVRSPPTTSLCYIYNKLKIPGPNGMITVSGDYKKARDCEEGEAAFAATYQRTMQRCLKDQIGRNVHAYVDDIAVMNRKGSDLLSDLKETFDNLRRDEVDEIAKCFLGYVVKWER